MRNAKLEAKLIRRQISNDNKHSMFAGYLNEVNRSAIRDPHLVGNGSSKGWAIVAGLSVLCIIFACAAMS